MLGKSLSQAHQQEGKRLRNGTRRCTRPVPSGPTDEDSLGMVFCFVLPHPSLNTSAVESNGIPPHLLQQQRSGLARKPGFAPRDFRVGFHQQSMTEVSSSLPSWTYPCAQPSPQPTPASPVLNALPFCSRQLCHFNPIIVKI